MAERDDISRLIGDLAEDLKPVRRVEAPLVSAFIWSGAVLAFAGLLYAVRDAVPWAGPLATDAFTVPGLVASGATAVLAAIAAFQVSFPDRSGAWALLPLPAFLAWLVINGLGCLAYAASPGAGPGAWPGFVQCLGVLLALSLPLSVLMILMVRRARPLRPATVAILGGLAAAGASQTLLVLVHPHDATFLDLAAHAIATVSIIGLNTLLGGRILVPANKFRRAT